MQGVVPCAGMAPADPRDTDGYKTIKKTNEWMKETEERGALSHVTHQEEGQAAFSDCEWVQTWN